MTKIDDAAGFHRAYDESGTDLMNLQKAVIPYDWFVRCIGLGPQTRKVNYDPSAPLHDRYTMDTDFLPAEDAQMLEDMTLTINAFFGWDFNSCEALAKGGVWYPIDFANACPDSQVTSLHYHFPWLIKANLRWSIFCAATGRKMRKNLDWEPFYAIADKDISPEERLSEYAKIAHQRFETEKFRDFCRKHLGHLDALAYDFFGSETMRDAVRKKVTALFPPHEIDEFTELFWQRVQKWREQEGARGDEDRLLAGTPTRIEQEITLVRWGHWGDPVLIFPTAGGDAEEIERMGLVGALWPLIESGRIKVFSCDNIAGRAFAARTGSVEYRCALLDRFEECVAREVVPAIRADCGGDVEVIAAGASLGAFMATAVACRYPWLFRAAVGMSGSYDLERVFEFKGTGDYYFATPMSFVPNLGGPLLDALRRRVRPPRLRRRAVGESGRLVAARRRARRQGHPEPGRSLGAGVRPRLAGVAARCCRSISTTWRGDADRRRTAHARVLRQLLAGAGRTLRLGATRGRCSSSRPPSASRTRPGGSGRFRPARRSTAPRSRSSSGRSSAGRSRATTSTPRWCTTTTAG